VEQPLNGFGFRLCNEIKKPFVSRGTNKNNTRTIEEWFVVLVVNLKSKIVNLKSKIKCF
jgi:hypothetical protein